MKIKCYHLFLILSCCFLFACKSDKKPVPVAAPNTPTVVPPKPGSVATPANISRPDQMTNNFERMQGEWRQVENYEQKLQIRGKMFVEIDEKNNTELANHCLLYTSPSPRDLSTSRMPSSA